MSGAADTVAETSPGTAASAWEDPPRAAPAGDVPILSVEGFEGPLDWLVEMARARQIDLSRLSIAALIGSFAMALEAALARPDGQVMRLAAWGDWLVMAATLAWLRSRLLLPADAPEARAAEDLRRRLVGRARIGAATDWLERQNRLGRDVFARGTPDVPPSVRGGAIVDLLRACLVALRVPEEQAAAARHRSPPLWTITEAIARVGKLLLVLPDGSALRAFLPAIAHEEPSRGLRCRAAVASTLIAGLELARNGVLTLEQDQAWAPIQLHRGGG